MRWEPGNVSSDVEDRRSDDGGGGYDDGGGGGGFQMRPMHLGIGGTVAVLALSLVFGRNFFAFLPHERAPLPSPVGQSHSNPRPHPAEGDKLVQFVSFVLDDVQSTWARELPAAGHPYHHAKLVLFTDHVRSGCGPADFGMGPFYCPADEKVYIDLAFYEELRTRFGAPGEFAEAYVIAHEVGHHVQKLLGTDAKMRREEQLHPELKNVLSVHLELQADCYAGVWAHATEQRKILEAGDIDSGLKAAAAVGDDRLQRQATGHVNPESWTHGSSEQRVAWFKRGYETGDISQCDTFQKKN